MTYLSVCSGIEAATVAWHPLGWTPWAFAEVDKFPSAVLAHHYPSVPNLGDMTRFQEWPDAALDLLVGGTPCQSFSVAGLRAGLDDPRGSLMLVYLAIARRYRPRWVVWENVPGVLSSDDGRAFGSFLRGLADLGYGFAYRVADAQYFGLAQRRARVFVVGYLGDWRRAAAVLFERASLSGHPAPSREAGEDVAPTIAARTRGGGGLGTDFDCDGGLIAKPLLAGGHANNPIDENLIATAFDARQSDVIQYGDKSGPLDTDGHTIGVLAFDTYNQSVSDVAHTLRVATDNGLQSTPHVLSQRMQVRRLTPLECCRLQGFPDTYLDIIYRGKPAADGPKYKALGNSFAVPVVRWIGERIAFVDTIESAA